ncbi:DUF2812 domain-containing protein [Radiobacillus deserti]|uniref:DUF2812 domain-containing protein n=1 Tax=Radiobacillus deserti TaxID=2594883 RepID=A0A516KJN6_9BACI|nr:DUF2812 domain-containing protein [Radiobacillus deserti]QDP41608.1 DUF2812 domain-containing protein [Radiobacillus deserti]
MNKSIYKLRPSDYWRIGEHESWFSDLAAKGLHLKKMGIHFAKFVKGEPKKMRYRIEVSFKKKISPEQIQMYSESGWDYITSYNLFHVFSSPEELDAPELHTDPAEQSYTLKELDKKLAANAVTLAISLLLIIGMLSAILFLDGAPILAMVEPGIIQQTILAIFIGYLTYTTLQASISIRALRRNLMEGKPIDHHAPWKKYYRINSTIAFLFIVVVGMSSVLSIVQLVKMDTKTLPEASVGLPIVRLADIEENPDLVRGEPSYVRDGVDWGNRYSYDWSPLAPLQYDTNEEGVVPGETWKDGSGEYTPSIDTQVFQLSIPALSDHLVFDLVERYRYEDNREEFVETEHADLDLLIVHEDEQQKEVFASKGKAVMYVKYHGYADLQSVIEHTVEKINLISD